MITVVRTATAFPGMFSHAEFRAAPPPKPLVGGTFECSIVREEPRAPDYERALWL